MRAYPPPDVSDVTPALRALQARNRQWLADDRRLEAEIREQGRRAKEAAHTEQARLYGPGQARRGKTP